MCARSIKDKAEEIVSLLKKEYPDAGCTLDHLDALQLLVATILSAQCTDARVNVVTKKLFKKYLSAADYAAVPQQELEEDIRSTGFYRNKAKNIRACCEKIVREFGSKVPATMEELTSLPGVGRKTANVVLGNAYGIAGVVVDTHVGRLSNRIGLSSHTDPEKIEKDLMRVIPEQDWTLLSHLLILHGRSVCFARKPECNVCLIRKLCRYGMKGHDERHT